MSSKTVFTFRRSHKVGPQRLFAHNKIAILKVFCLAILFHLNISIKQNICSIVKHNFNKTWHNLKTIGNVKLEGNGECCH